MLVSTWQTAAAPGDTDWHAACLQLCPNPSLKLQKRWRLPGSATAVRLHWDLPLNKLLEWDSRDPVPSRIWCRSAWPVAQPLHASLLCEQLHPGCIFIRGQSWWEWGKREHKKVALRPSHPITACCGGKVALQSSMSPAGDSGV